MAIMGNYAAIWVATILLSSNILKVPTTTQEQTSKICSQKEDVSWERCCDSCFAVVNVQVALVCGSRDTPEGGGARLDSSETQTPTVVYDAFIEGKKKRTK